MRLSRTVVAVAVLASAACASTSSRADGPETRDRLNRITYEEIQEATQQNGLQLVRELRPGWRGTPYLDGYRLGSMSELSTIPASSIREIEYLEPIDAAARFGIEHEGGGAILVKTR
jgi:hypothetical protein